MELNDKVTQLEDEIKILKNEVQAVLLDLRESYLNHENPFTADASPGVSSPTIVINQPAPAAAKEPVPAPEENPEGGLLGLVDNTGEPELVNEFELPGEPEPANEPAPVREMKMAVSKDTTHEEMRTWRSEIMPESHLQTGETDNVSKGKIDLENLAGLAQWVEETVKIFSCERTEAILDISEMMGYLAPEFKKVLIKFIRPSPGEYTAKVTTRDYLASINKLADLLGKKDKSEVAMLYILCKESDHR